MPDAANQSLPTPQELRAQLDSIRSRSLSNVQAATPEPKKRSDSVLRLAEFGIPGTKKKIVAEMKDVGGSAFSDALERGVTGTIGMVDYSASLLGRLADKAGIPGAREYADRKLGEAVEMFSYGEKVAPARINIQELLATPSWKNFGTFAAETLGEQLPNLLLTFGAGGLAGGLVKGAVVKEATKRLGQKAALSTAQRRVSKLAGEKAAKAAGTAAAATIIPLETGEAGYNIRQQTGEDSPLTAIGAGVINAYLEKLVPQKILKDVLAADGPAKKMLWREALGNTAKTVATNLAQEGITEVAQEGVQVAATKLADSSYDAVSPENFWRLLEAGVKGALVGGTISIPSSAYSQTSRKLSGDVLDTPVGKALQKIEREMQRRRDDAIKQGARRESDTNAAATTRPTPNIVPKETVGTTAQPKPPEQAKQGAPQGVVAAGNERTLNGTKYTKRDDFWYYTDRRGREKIVEGGTPKQDKLLEQLENQQPDSDLQVRESRVGPADLDAEYAAAVERGDEEKAKSLLRQAYSRFVYSHVALPMASGGFKYYPATFIRIGDVPTKDGIQTASTGFDGGVTERGVSVYGAWRDPRTGKIVLQTGSGQSLAGVDEAAGQGRPVLIVQGDLLRDVGSDGEPLMVPGTVRVVGRASLSDVVTDDSPEVAIDGTELSDAEMPNWNNSGIEMPFSPSSVLRDSSGNPIPLSQRFGRETRVAPPLVASPPASATPPAAAPQTLPVQTTQSGGDLSDTPIPDTREQIAAQLAATADPQNPKAATLILRGAQVPPLPQGLVAIETSRGTVVTNPRKADPKIAAAQIEAGQGGRLLGYSSDVKPKGRVAVVQGRNAQGVAVTEEVTDAAGLPGAIAAASAQGAPTVASEAQVVNERVRDSRTPSAASTAAAFPQSNVQLVQQAVARFFGYTPQRVEVVYDPAARWNARLINGERIQINAAKLDARITDIKIIHELGHALFKTPVFRDAFQSLMTTLSPSERESVAMAMAHYSEEAADIQSEEQQVIALEEIMTVMRMPKNRTAWQEFAQIVSDAFQSFFGVPPVSREMLAARMVAIAKSEFVMGDLVGDAAVEATDETTARESLTTTASQVELIKQRLGTETETTMDLESAATQNDALHRVLSRVAGEMGASPRVRQVLGLQQIENVLAAIPDETRRMTYEQAMSAITDAGARKSFQWDVFSRLMLFHNKVDRMKRRLRELTDKMASTAGMGRIAKEEVLRQKVEVKALAASQYLAIIQSAINHNLSRLETEKDEAVLKQIREELRALNDQANLRVGVAETIDQIVNDLVRDTDALETLSGDPTMPQILAEWKRVNADAPTGAPVARFAAYILSRNTNLGPKLARLREMKQDPAIADEVSRAGVIMRNALKRAVTDVDRIQVMQGFFEKANDKQASEYRAYRRWFDLHQDIQRDIDRANGLADAIRIGEAVVSDEQFKRVLGETQEAVNAIVVPEWWDDKELKSYLQETLKTKTDPTTLAQMGIVTIVLPDGTAKVHRLSADTATLARAIDEMSKDADIIADWLVKNPDNPYAPYYEVQLNNIRGTYLTTLVTENNKNLAIGRGIPFLRSNLGILRFALRDIGTPAAKIAAKLAEAWDATSEYMERWMKDWYWKAPKLLSEAAKSHGIKRASDPNWFLTWERDVGNELFARLQSTGSGVEVGTPLSTGYEVTKEDMAFVRFIQRASEDAFRKTSLPLQGLTGVPEINDFINRRVPVIRERLDRGDAVVTRRIDRTVGLLVSSVIEALNQPGLDAQGRYDLAESILGEQLARHVESYLHDMHPDFAKRTRLTEALKLAGERLKEKRNADRNGVAYDKPYPAMSLDGNLTMQGLYEFVADHIDTTESEGEMSRDELIDLVRREFLGTFTSDANRSNPDKIAFRPGEFGKILLNFLEESTDKVDLTKKMEVTVIDQHNTFNSARGRRVAPFAFYKHGLVTEGDWLSFRSNGASFQMEMMLNALRAVENDISTKLEAVKKQFGIIGGSLSAEAIKEGKRQLKSGETMYEWDRLQEQLDEIQSFTKSLEDAYGKGGKANQHEMRRLSRAVGILIRGLLSSGLVAIGNVISPQAAAVRASMTGAVAKSFAGAYGNLAKEMLRGVYGAVKSTPAALKELAMLNAAGAFEELFDGAIKRGGVNRELARYGLDTPMRTSDKFRSMYSLPVTGGRLIERKPWNTVSGALNGILGTLATGVEGMWTLLEPIQPEYGDRFLNAAAWQDSNALVEWLEGQLRKLYGRYKASGLDPKGAPLDPGDIYGAWLGKPAKQTNLNNLNEWFNQAGVPFRESVHRFFDSLDRAGNTEDAIFLTPTERDALAIVLTSEINKATRSKRPIQASTNIWYSLFFILKGWSFFDLTRKRHRLGRAAATGGGLNEVRIRARQLAMLLALTAAMGAVGWDLVEILKRYYAWYVRGEKRASRAWWEQEGFDKMLGLMKSWGSQYPVVGDIATFPVDDLPGNARQGSILSPVILSRLSDIVGYFGGVLRSGDPRMGLRNILTSTGPEIAIPANRLPQNSGSVSMLNARRLLSRHGDKEWLAKTFFGGGNASATYTPIHPIIERAVNAIGNGDYDIFMRHYREAVEKAEAGGKTYKTVLAMLKSRHPVSRAYKSNPPPEIMEKFLSRMPGDERAQVEDAIEKYNRAIAMVSPSPAPKLVSATPSYAPSYRGSSSRGKIDLRPVYDREKKPAARSTATRRPTLPSRFRTPTLAQMLSRRSNARRRPTIRI